MIDLKKHIRDIPDFPKKGILFKDITTLLADKDAFRAVIDNFIKRYTGSKIDAVVAAEARGFIFGGAIAYGLGVKFVPVRKKGKLPHNVIVSTYELEYGTDSLHMHEDAVKEGENILVVDDLLATGGTAKAICELVEKLKGKVAEVAFMIELSDLKGRDKLKGYKVYSQVVY